MAEVYLESERLIIKEYEILDLDDYYRLFSNEEVMYYTPSLKLLSKEAAKIELNKAIEEKVKEKEKRIHYFLKIEHKEFKYHIGSIGYSVLDITPIGNIVEIGYFIYPEYWNVGYTTEAVKKVLEFAFDKNSVYRFKAVCIAENTGSERVMQKAGMIKEGHFKEMAWHNGKMRDRLCYRMLRSEWHR